MDFGVANANPRCAALLRCIGPSLKQLSGVFGGDGMLLQQRLVAHPPRRLRELHFVMAGREGDDDSDEEDDEDDHVVDVEDAPTVPTAAAAAFECFVNWVADQRPFLLLTSIQLRGNFFSRTEILDKMFGFLAQCLVLQE
jgi:hypothetical protein